MNIIGTYDQILGGASQKLVHSVLQSVRVLLDEAGKELVEDKKMQIERLQSENVMMKERLNSVLSATWRFTEEGWQGTPEAPPMPPLKGEKNVPLTLADKEKMEALWEVPAAFDPHEAKMAAEAAAGHVHEFTVRPHWNGHEVEEDHWANEMKRASTLTQALKQRYTVTQEMKEQLSLNRRKCKLSEWITEPGSKKRNCWDVFSTIMIFYDFITVPLSLFDAPENVFTNFMNITTITFWTLDMLVSCLTGYVQKNGKVMMEPGPVIRHYIKTQLPFDIVVNGLDWLFYILEMVAVSASSRAGDTGRILKMRRIVRVVRLYRLVKLSRIRRMIFMFMQRWESDLVFVLPLFARIVVLAGVGGHIFGTCWYAVGLLGQATNTANNWIDNYELMSRSWLFRYVLSFWFSVNKLLLCDSDIHPQNTGECMFAGFVLICGIINLFYFAAQTLRAFQSLFSVRSESFKEFFLLRAYLKQHAVQSNLAFRVTTYAENVCKPLMELVPASKLDILPLLSQQLRCELSVSVDFCGVFAHPLFEQCRDNPDLMHSFGNPACNVLKNLMLASGDPAFSAGNRAKKMITVTAGQLHYMKQGVYSVDYLCQPGEWLAEHALWCVWTHQGDCCASTDSQCVTVDAHNFWEAVEKDTGMFVLMSRYAHIFIEELNHDFPVSLVDITPGDSESAADQVERYIINARAGAEQSRRISVSRMSEDAEDGDAGDNSTVDSLGPRPPLHDPPPEM